MHYREAQSIGALFILVISLFVYGWSLFNGRHPFPVPPPHWADQEPGMIAMEVAGSTGADGIYFLPREMTVGEKLKAAGVDGEFDAAGEAISAGIDYTIVVEGKVVRYRDMPAIRKIALGRPIDVNRASADDLSLVPGIGKTLAAQIVELRQMREKFDSLVDLMTVRGIKEKKLNALGKYLVVKKTSP
jgi:hypothetical protein